MKSILVSPDSWYYIAIFILTFQIFLFIIPNLRFGGMLAITCWLIGLNKYIWITISILLLISTIIYSINYPPFFNLWRVSGYLIILLISIFPFFFQTYPSSYDKTPSKIKFKLPLNKKITVVWGGATKDINYHVFAPDQRWAYDFIITKNSKSYKNSGKKLEDYYCYNQPIFAPANGIVKYIENNIRDKQINEKEDNSVFGNRIIIEIAENQFLFICHFKYKSIKLKVGDKISQGELLGRVGNSGNSSEPHIHIHLQDSIRDYLAESIPFYFYNYICNNKIIHFGIPKGGIIKNKFVGDIIKNQTNNK